MTKRTKVLLSVACGILALGAGVRYAVLQKLSLSDEDFPQRQPWRYGAPSDPTKPRVVIGYEPSGHHMSVPAVRIDVRQGLAHSRKEGAPIVDLVSYLNAELLKQDAKIVIVSASRDEKIGNIVRVLDESRRSDAKAIMWNQSLEPWPK